MKAFTGAVFALTCLRSAQNTLRIIISFVPRVTGCGTWGQCFSMFLLATNLQGLLNEIVLRRCICTRLPTVSAKYSTNYHLICSEADGVRNLGTMLLDVSASDKLARTINESVVRRCIFTRLPTRSARSSMNYYLICSVGDGVRNLRAMLLVGVASDSLVRTIK